MSDYYEGMYRATFTLVQDTDTCAPIELADEMNTLEIEAVHNNDGCYFIIKTERWAFDDLKDLIRQLKFLEKTEELPWANYQ